MVSKERIKENMEDVKKLFSEYNSIIDELQQYWKGLSHDNLVNKATEFSANFSKTIETQFDYFAKIIEGIEKSIQKLDIVIDNETLDSTISSGNDNYIPISIVKTINEEVANASGVKLDAATQNYNV